MATWVSTDDEGGGDYEDDSADYSNEGREEASNFDVNYGNEGFEEERFNVDYGNEGGGDKQYEDLLREMGVPVDLIEVTTGSIQSPSTDSGMTQKQLLHSGEGSADPSSDTPVKNPAESSWDFTKLFDPKYAGLFGMIGSGISSALSDKRKEEAAEKAANSKYQNDASIYARNRSDSLADREALRKMNLEDGETSFNRSLNATNAQNAFLAEQNRLNRENSLAIANLRGGGGGGGGGGGSSKPEFASIGSYTRTPGK